MIALIVFALIVILVAAAVFGKVDWFQAAVGIILLLLLLAIFGEIPDLSNR
jgi:hypothetical protein